MSKADKMFEELGYEKAQDDICVIYTLKFGLRLFCEQSITFYFETKQVSLENEWEIYVINQREFKAIHEKLTELGWLDEK